MPASNPPYVAKPALNLFYEHFAQLAVQMQQAYRLHKASVNIGTTRELFVASFLRRHLPRSVWVGRGEILDSDGCRSGDCDVVVYRGTSPALPSDPGETLHLFLAEGVDSVVEVKSNLSGDELAKCIKACRQIKKLKTGNAWEGHAAGFPEIAIVPEGYNAEPLARIRYFVVAFEGISDASIHSQLLEAYATPADYYQQGVDGICILDRSYIYKHDGLVWPADAADIPANATLLTRNTDDLLCLYTHLTSPGIFTIHKSLHFADYLQRGAADCAPTASNVPANES